MVSEDSVVTVRICSCVSFSHPPGSEPDGTVTWSHTRAVPKVRGHDLIMLFLEYY